MKRVLIAALALLAGVAAAQAGHYETTDYDLLRPHGRPRSEAVHQAAVDFCNKQTGDNPDLADTPAFRKCLLGRGYRVQSEHWVGRSPAPPPPVAGGLDGVYVYDDASPGPLRSDKQEEDASRACGRGGKVTIGSPPFNACMLANNWQFSRFEPTKRPKAAD